MTEKTKLKKATELQTLISGAASASTRELAQKISNRTFKASIIGLGYVGLPLAIEFGKSGVEVIGFDIDPIKIESIRQGKSYIQDVSTAELQQLISQKKFRATSDFSVIQEIDTVNICVPTPLRKSKDPDISYIVAAAKEIAQYIHPGMLVILESTTYPGTTEEVILPMLEETGLKAGTDFHLAFSPERVDPGNPKFNTRNIPKVVGGLTPACTLLAQSFYEIAIEQVHPVSCPRSAEMVKLLENTFRSVNIGLANELCQMSEKLGVDVWEIIDAAATKPFGFMPFYPGPGLGGHCIPIDPHYLAWKARMTGFNPRFIDLASDVNHSMPEYVVRKAQSLLNENSKALKGSRIHLFGVTYKKNVSDVRESPAVEIMEMLIHLGAELSYTDPFVPEVVIAGHALKSTHPNEGVDLALILTNHDAFDYEAIAKQFCLILDTRNVCKGKNVKKI